MTDKEVNKLIEKIIEDDINLEKNEEDEKVLPLVALRGKVLFPKTILNFYNRTKTRAN